MGPGQSPTNIKQNCVLTGIVYDESGDRLSPTYAKKYGRYYRYYTSKKSAHENDEKGTGWRIPSKELEGAVAEGIRNFLRDQRHVIDSVGVASAPPDDQQNIIAAAAELADAILRVSPDQNAENFRKLISRVDLGSEKIRIMISPRGLSELVGAGNRLAEDALPLSFEIPVSFRRRGVERKIVIGGENRTPLIPDGNLIQHVRRSHDWWRLLTKGECQRRSNKGPPWRCKKGPLGGCGLVPVVHGRAPRAPRRALDRLTRRRAREGPVGPRGQAWAGWSVQLAVGV